MLLAYGNTVSIISYVSLFNLELIWSRCTLDLPVKHHAIFATLAFQYHLVIMWQIIWVSVKHRVARYQGLYIESKSLVDLTIKRPDDTSDHDVTPSTLHSRSSSTDSTHQLEETCNENEESLLHISDVIRDINTGEPHNSMEFSLLSEANHTYHLVQSFKSSRFAEVLDERIKKPHSHYPKQQPGNYSSFSMIQFMHELVRKQVILDHTHTNLCSFWLENPLIKDIYQSLSRSISLFRSYHMFDSFGYSLGNTFLASRCRFIRCTESTWRVVLYVCSFRICINKCIKYVQPRTADFHARTWEWLL